MPFDIIEIQRREDDRERGLENKFKLAPVVLPVVLCNAEGEYEGTDGLPLSAQVEGDPVRIWARMFGESPPGQFLNIRGVPAYTGIPAYAGYLDDSQEMEILSVNVAEYTELVRELKERHALQHQPGGFDPLDVLLSMIVPLRITAQSGLTVQVAPLAYSHSGAYVWFPGQNNFDLTASIPGAGLARYTLVYLDPADNTIKVVDGDTVPDTLSIVPDQPAPPDDTYPAGWVRLANGQTQINQVSDVKEARLLLNRFNPLAEILNNYTAATDPGAGDDSGDGYSVGSVWINVTADTAWVCVDSTPTAAVWRQIDAAAGSGGGGAQNILINGNFQSWPEQTTFTAATTIVNNDKTYFADQWVYLAETTDVADISRENLNGDGGQYYAKFLIATANNQFAAMQPLSSAKSLPLRNQTVSLFLRGFTGTGAEIANIRAAVLRWAGTADAMTDPVATWAGSGTNPTLATDWSYASTPSNLALVANDWTTFKVENVALGTSFNNLAILIWVDDEDAAVNDILGLATVGLFVGETAPDVYPAEDTGRTIADCEWYFETLGGENANQYFGFGGAISTTQVVAIMGYRKKRIIPSISVSNVTHFAASNTTGTRLTCTNVQWPQITRDRTSAFLTVASGLVAGEASIFLADNTSSARVYLNSRLTIS